MREQTKVVGHAVRAMYMYTAMADLAAELGDASLEKTCEALWADVTRTRMYVTGGFGDLQVIDHQVMTHANLSAVNSLSAQATVTPAKGKGAKIDNGSLTLALKPHSYTMIRLGRR